MESSRYGWQAPDVGGSDGAATEADGSGDAKPLRIGFVGVGNMGQFSLRAVMDQPDASIVAVCDVEADHLAQAMELLGRAPTDDSVLQFSDFRELIRCPDIDAVIISTPDHWHAQIGIDAMRVGKDVYIEKPLALTIAEGRALCDVAEETGRISQTGTQQRSSREFRFACELIRNGCLGELQAINVCVPYNNKTCPPTVEPMPVPDTLDYDMWLGPAPLKPYHELRCHYTFRFVSDYSGGQMTNWGAHSLDIVQWALGMDHSGPVEVSGRGEFPSSGLFDTATDVDVEFTYDNDVRVHCTSGVPHIEFIGSDNSMVVGRGRIETTQESLLEHTFADGDVRLYQSDDHYKNFFNCIRTREQTVAPVAVGHRSATLCHIGNIAMRLGRRLGWDPVGECFDDDEANAFLERPRRSPWHI